MQEIKNLSIRYIKKHYLFNLNKEQREILTNRGRVHIKIFGDVVSI